MFVSDDLGCNIAIRESVTYNIDLIINHNIQITKILDHQIKSIEGLTLETTTA
jgi:hypothetical protein